jgi:hypothetical protein
MKLSHEDIKTRLPEYISGVSMPEEVETHLKECRECMEEASLLREILEIKVPDPGNMFFKTLSQKVRVSLKEKKKGLFLRFAPAFTLLLLVVTTGYLYYRLKTPDMAGEELSFSNPLASQPYDLSGFSVEDIPSINENLEGEALYDTEDISFAEEFASLNAEEIEALYESINMNNKNGGVL